MPRRTAITGPDKSAGINEFLRIQYDGDAVLTGKNELDIPLFDQLTTLGGLQGWALDNAPEEVSYGVYAKGPGQTRPTRQATLDFEHPMYDQRDPLVDGDPAPDQTHRSIAVPFALPPVVELVAAAFAGYAAGWWAWTYAFGIGAIGSGLQTEVAPLAAFLCGQGQGFRIPLPTSISEGCTHIILGANGPFPDPGGQLAALNTTVIYRQKDIPTHPRWPAAIDMQGHFLNQKQLSFDVNTTEQGDEDEDEENRAKPKHKKKKPPGGPKRKKARRKR